VQAASGRDRLRVVRPLDDDPGVVDDRTTRPEVTGFDRDPSVGLDRSTDRGDRGHEQSALETDVAVPELGARERSAEDFDASCAEMECGAHRTAVEKVEIAVVGERGLEIERVADDRLAVSARQIGFGIDRHERLEQPPAVDAREVGHDVRELEDFVEDRCARPDLTVVSEGDPAASGHVAVDDESVLGSGVAQPEIPSFDIEVACERATATVRIEHDQLAVARVGGCGRCREQHQADDKRSESGSGAPGLRGAVREVRWIRLHQGFLRSSSSVAIGRGQVGSYRGERVLAPKPDTGRFTLRCGRRVRGCRSSSLRRSLGRSHRSSVQSSAGSDEEGSRGDAVVFVHGTARRLLGGRAN